VTVKRSRWPWAVAVLLLATAAVVGGVVWLNVRGEEDTGQPTASAEIDAPDAVERGAYLARAGNCAGCHTARGGPPYAGGRGIDTPFGTVYASNLTPDAATGLGGWTASDFWRALHHGRSKDGRLLYPAFPYPNYTQVTRADADAIFAFLRSQPAVAQANRPQALRFPYNTQAALAIWRAAFYKPGVFEADAHQSAEWNRGAYLVRGLGHCEACHAPRNSLGATSGSAELSGGIIAAQRWYAPSLAAASEAGVADWEPHEIVALLKTGRVARASGLVTVMGPMADVVYRSTQHLSDGDLQAIATFLKQLPQTAAASQAATAADAAVLDRGAVVYKDRCSACHGKQGQGAAPAYPPLAGDRAVTMASPANLVRVVVSGGYLPATAGNPRPYGMPPFGQELPDADIAAVTTFVRQSWGNRAGAVSALDVLRGR
jgi:mono/diheme cytochrome c family protein